MPGVVLFRDDADPKLRDTMAISDAKGLCDGLRKEARGKEPRTAESFRQFRSGGNKEPRPRRDHKVEMEAMMAEEARVAKEAMAIRRRMKEEGRRL